VASLSNSVLYGEVRAGVAAALAYFSLTSQAV